MPLRFGPPEHSSKGQVTRHRILEALHDLLRTSPAARVSVADVAQRAEMKRSSVYNHFRTVDEMCLALVDRSLSAVFAGFGRADATNLGTYFSSALMSTFRLWALHRVVLVIAFEIYARDRAFARAWDERVTREWTEPALEVYQADVTAGRLSPLPDPRGLLDLLAFTIQHQLHRLWRDGVPSPQDCHRELELCATASWRLLGLPGDPVLDRATVDEILVLAGTKD